MSMAMRIGEAGYGRSPCPDPAPSSPGGCCTGPDYDYGRTAARRGSTSTGRRPSTGSRSTAARSTTSSSARARRSSSSTASAPPGSRGSRSCRSSRATTAWWPWTCPASATPRCPREDISIEYYARWTVAAARRAGDRVGGGGGQLDGRLRRAEMAIKSPQRVQRLVFVSRGDLLAEPAPRPAAGAARAAVRRRRGPRAGARHRRHRDAAAAALRGRSPRPASAIRSTISDELAHEMVRSARRTDGFLPALEALAGYELEEELPKISCPTLIVWGAHDQLVSVKDAERLRGPDPRLAARGVRAHRPRGDARAAGALQPAAARLPRAAGSPEAAAAAESSG